MKLSDIKGEDALDVLADIIDPITEISQDKEAIALFRSHDRSGSIKKMIRDHKKSIITILAILNKEDPNTYQPDLISLPMMLLELFNDPAVMSLFPSQGQTMEKTSFGSATGNTEAHAE